MSTDAWVLVGPDGFTSVKSADGVVQTRLPLADVLLSWLEGRESFGLGPPDVPGGHAPFAIPLFDVARASRVTWLMIEPGARAWRERWAALVGELGVIVPTSSQLDTEPQSAAVYLPQLEMTLSWSSQALTGGLEQISLQHYEDRAERVKDALTTALAATGAKLVRVEGPRGPARWWPVTSPSA